MSEPVDGPLATWSVAGDGSPAVTAGLELLAELGAAVGRPGTGGLRLAAPEGAAHTVSPLGVDADCDWAASGATWLTGRADGPPLLPGGAVASRAGGALLAVRLLSRLLGAEVDIDGRRLLGERAAIAGLRRRGPSSPGGGTRVLAGRGGSVAVTLSRDDDVAALPALLERKWVGDPWSSLTRWVARTPVGDVIARAELLGIPAAAVPADTPPRLAAYRLVPGGPRRPVPPDGPLVVDLTSMWAGPLAAHLLGLAGCRVVKVELNGRPDGARRGPAAFYDLLHHGHFAAQIDVREPSGRSPRLRELLAAADVVLESARPRAMRQLGISPADGGGSWVAVRAYDSSGPRAERPGFGDDVAAGTGSAVVLNGRLLPVGDAIADPVAGACAAVAALAVLVGRGRWQVETSLEQALSGATAVTEGRPASRLRRGWVVATAAGSVAVSPPYARCAAGRAAPSGADDARLDALLGC